MSAPSKEQFCQSLNADTWCGWDWCRKLYGYSVTDPTILERVFARLDELNRPMVKHIYTFYIKTQIAHEMEQTQDVGARLVEQIDRDYERKVRKNGNNKTEFRNWHGFKGFPSIH